MFAVRKILFQKEHLKNCLIGYGVIMPDETFLYEGPEIESHVLLDNRHYEEGLEEYLQKLGKFWTAAYLQKHGKSPKTIEKPMIEEIRQLLRPEVRSSLTLNSVLCTIERQQVELTDEQCRILRRMDSNPRTLVCGGAGTGKTILGMDKAVQKACSGQRVLFLCFNRLLGKHLRSHAQAKHPLPNLEINSIHAWFQEVITEAGFHEKLTNFPQTDSRYFTEHYPEVFMDAFIHLDKEPFDCIVLDEAQDVLQSHFLDVLDLFLSEV